MVVMMAPKRMSSLSHCKNITDRSCSASRNRLPLQSCWSFLKSGLHCFNRSGCYASGNIVYQSITIASGVVEESALIDVYIVEVA